MENKLRTWAHSLRGGTAQGLGQGEGLSMCSSPGSVGSLVLEDAGLITHRRKENAQHGGPRGVAVQGCLEGLVVGFGKGLRKLGFPRE